MQLYFIVFLFFLIIQTNLCTIPKMVKYINLLNFSGMWYESAKTYNSFEKNNVATTIKYKFIDLINKCFEKKIENKLIAYDGRFK